MKNPESLDLETRGVEIPWDMEFSKTNESLIENSGQEKKTEQRESVDYEDVRDTFMYFSILSILEKILEYANSSKQECIFYVKNVVFDLRDYYKSKEGLRGRERAETFLDDFSCDFIKIIDEKNVVDLLQEMIANNQDETTDEMQQKMMKEFCVIAEELVNLVEKYIKLMVDMFTSGLYDNFKNVPEPMKSNFIENKDDIKLLVKNLLRLGDLCKELGPVLTSIPNLDDKNMESYKEAFSKQFETLLADKPQELDNTVSDLKRIFFEWFPSSWEYIGEEKGMKLYRARSIGDFIKYVDKIPENSCMVVYTKEFTINFFSNKRVKLKGNAYDELFINNGKWGIKSGKLYIKDDKGNVFCDDIDSVLIILLALFL